MSEKAIKDEMVMDTIRDMVDKDGLSISEIARRLEVNKGLVSMAYNTGVYSPTLRRALDYPVPTLVEPCQECGELHLLPGDAHPPAIRISRRSKKTYSTVQLSTRMTEAERKETVEALLKNGITRQELFDMLRSGALDNSIRTEMDKRIKMEVMKAYWQKCNISINVRPLENTWLDDFLPTKPVDEVT